MRKISLIITLLATTFFAFANDVVFSLPSVPTLVADNANVFTSDQRMALEDKLNTLSRESSTQILVYTTTDLHGYDIADFGQRLGEGWGVGQDGFDNGIVIVYKPKTDTTSGEVTIQIGYGIEPLIPDITCKRIIDQEMIPRFQQGQVYGGINAAVDICISLTKGEFSADEYSHYGKESPVGSILFIIVILIVGYVLYAAYGQFTFGRRPSVFSYLWFILKILGKAAAKSGRSGSSSGFGGYGGGHFGGGGASGRW